MPNYIALSRETHSTKRWQHPASYIFASNEAVAPLAAQEFPKAMMSLPIAFYAHGDSFQATAVLGLEQGKSLFVAQDGRWLGGYVPAIFRTYPFRLADTPEGQKVMCIDLDSGLQTDGPEGEKFFYDDGAPASEVSQALELLNQLETSRAVTAAGCAVLQACKLIVPWDISVKTDTGEQKIEGLYKVDETAMNALSNEEFLRLREHGALAMAYCQLLSMQHLLVLGELAQAEKATNGASSQISELDFSMSDQDGIISFDGL